MLRELRYSCVDIAVKAALVMGAVASASLAAEANDPKAAPAVEAGAPKQAPAQAENPAAGKPAPSSDPSTYGVADVTPFTEHTTVDGKIDVNLQGVWLLVANVEVLPGTGKFRTFPQLLKITQGKDGPQLNLLDVQLPASVQQSLQADQKTMAPWVSGVRQTLAQNWSRYRQSAKASTVLYGKIDYLVRHESTWQH
jgi:hypothetical protein